ncbi:MAG: aminomethyl-transferring glycine dehydrogenase subunit GcvPA [Candidatus Abyssobacteria bacterium SURF_5]|uniref:Aminomethyl-transferring glycine dehydrogenase subunit GcvPA n=1 Tax=Abyssobacteria bacterium (strain SURF_5) TaxID=2093360 RepID=A0A3A4NSR0_ABYX5|nr:MAG: aminomethyl-transferring glycine dehydrogenase subunit GcvPA [Candidatus Abyssubacteria bacterium SURF_5]
MKDRKIVYPYIPNSVGEIKEQMLKEVGAQEVMELYAEIPEHLRFKGRMKMPEPILDECSIRRHVDGLLRKNANCCDHLNFLGAGCAQHYVPAVCDEINGRGEFLTAYSSIFWADHGKWQAWFEYVSLMAELLDMDYLSLPTYDGAQAAATSLRMARGINGRTEVLLPASMHPQIQAVVRNYLKGVPDPALKIGLIDYDRTSGLLDLEDLRAKISDRTAAVLIENPSYFGIIEAQAEEIGRIARERGAEFIVYADPISLGVLAPPAHYGATIACGDLHPLGIHMQCGGGQSGFIATGFDMDHAMQFKDIVVGIQETVEDGEYGFGVVFPHKLSYFTREEGNEFTGTNTGLWAITAAVYLSLMGPKGMEEIGRTIMQRSQYAAKKLGEIDGVRVLFSASFFKEFVVNFDETGRKVEKINRKLLKAGVFGGLDLSKDFPALGQSALYCVTEIMTKDDIDHLVEAVKKAVK